MECRRFVAPMVALGLAVGAAPAAAHPELDEAGRLLAAADFTAALAAFDRAEASGALTLAEVVTLCEGRALVYLAQGNEAAMARALGCIAALEPDHAFAREAPPDLVEAYRSVRERSGGPLGLEVRARPTPGGLVLRAELTNAPEGLVREVRVSGRAGRGPWRSAEGELAIAASQRAPVLEAHASALGPGSAVLATAGTEGSPRRLRWPAGAGLAPSASGAGQDVLRVAVPEEEEDERSSGGGGPWIWVGVGAGVLLVAGGVIALVAAGADSDATQPTAPTVLF
jgi:hypothetical protein